MTSPLIELPGRPSEHVGPADVVQARIVELNLAKEKAEREKEEQPGMPIITNPADFIKTMDIFAKWSGEFRANSTVGGGWLPMSQAIKREGR